MPGPPFEQLRDALGRLALPAAEQRRNLVGGAVEDELALDLQAAVSSLDQGADRSGVRLDPACTARLHDLEALLDAPPDDPLWSGLDDHPTWERARVIAGELLVLLSS